MKCCQCKNVDLEPKQLEPGLLAAFCPNCHGSLLPLMNYRYWAEQRHEVHKTQSEVAEEPAGAKRCPKCSGMMTKYRIGNETQNRLELCAHCDEMWLDSGEWDLVKDLDLHDRLSSVFTDAWQRNIRLQKETDNLRAYYSKLIGPEEFQKLEDLKQWIDQHEKRGEILHYLNTRLSML